MKSKNISRSGENNNFFGKKHSIISKIRIRYAKWNGKLKIGSAEGYIMVWCPGHPRASHSRVDDMF